jgi:hypothetical protein
VDSPSRKNVETAQKPHLRRPPSQKDLEAAVLIRPQKNDRGSITGINHKRKCDFFRMRKLNSIGTITQRRSYYVKPFSSKKPYQEAS